MTFKRGRYAELVRLNNLINTETNSRVDCGYVIIENVVRICIADIPSALITDLKKLNGLPPFHGLTHFQADGHFSRSIKERYPPRLIEAAQLGVINPMMQRLQKVLEDFESNL